MIRPKFISSAETPSTAIDRRLEQTREFLDRAGRQRRGVAVRQPATAVERHQPLLAERERVDLQFGDVRSVVAAVDAEALRERA